MSFRTDRVRLVVLITKRDDISREEFSRYWVETHGKLFASLAIVQKNLLKYEQAHVNDVVAAVVGSLPNAAPVVACDGMAIFEADSHEKILEIFADEEYIRAVIPDEEKFFNRAATQLFPVDLATIIDKQLGP